MNLNLSDEQRLICTSFLQERFRELKAQRDPLDLKVKDWVANYNSVKATDKEEWEHNYFVPYTFMIIKSIFPKLYFSLFGNDKWLKAIAEEDSKVGTENKISTWLQRILERLGFVKLIYKAIKKAMIYPNCVIKRLWDTTTCLPSVQIVDYFDYFQDIRYSEIKDAPDCFHRIVMPRSQVNTRFLNGVYDKTQYEKFQKTTMTMDIESIQMQVMNYFISGTDTIISERRDSSTNKSSLMNVEVLEWHGKYDINKDGIDEDVVMTILNREVLARAYICEGEIKPFNKLSVDDEPSGFYGKTYTSMLEESQYMLNDLVNYRFDNLATIINKMFYIRRGSLIDQQTLFSAPNNVIELDDLGDIREAQFTNILGDSYQQESMIRQDMQSISGMIDYSTTPEMMKGVGATATGMSILTSEAVSKFREPLDVLKEDVLELINDIFTMTKKYASNIVMLRVKSYDSSEFYDVTAEDIKNNYTFRIQFRNFLPNKQAVLQNMVTLLNIIGNTKGVNVIAYIKNILDLMDEIKNPEEILPALKTQNEAEVKRIRQQSIDQDVNKIAQNILKGMGGGVPTPEETLVNPQEGLGSPINPTLKTSGPNDMTTIQSVLGG